MTDRPSGKCHVHDPLGRFQQQQRQGASRRTLRRRGERRRQAQRISTLTVTMTNRRVARVVDGDETFVVTINPGKVGCSCDLEAVTECDHRRAVRHFIRRARRRAERGEVQS
jgi:hypothetical protein